MPEFPYSAMDPVALAYAHDSNLTVARRHAAAGLAVSYFERGDIRTEQVEQVEVPLTPEQLMGAYQAAYTRAGHLFGSSRDAAIGSHLAVQYADYFIAFIHALKSSTVVRRQVQIALDAHHRWEAARTIRTILNTEGTLGAGDEGDLAVAQHVLEQHERVLRHRFAEACIATFRSIGAR